MPAADAVPKTYTNFAKKMAKKNTRKRRSADQALGVPAGSCFLVLLTLWKGQTAKQYVYLCECITVT